MKIVFIGAVKFSEQALKKMIEIIQAIIVIFLITVTSYFPEKYLLMLKKNKNIKSIGLVDKLTIGMVAQLFFLTQYLFWH